jgi:hypothetical protein
MIADQELVLGLAGGFLTIVTGALAFTHVRISQVREEGKRDLEDLQQQLTERLKDGQADRNSMRLELQAIGQMAARQHEDILNRLGQVATRDEIKGDLQQFKSDFQHLENRITQALRHQDVMGPPRSR